VSLVTRPQLCNFYKPENSPLRTRAATRKITNTQPKCRKAMRAASRPRGPTRAAARLRAARFADSSWPKAFAPKASSWVTPPRTPKTYKEVQMSILTIIAQLSSIGNFIFNVVDHLAKWRKRKNGADEKIEG
jgi:hypothetical protein